MADKPGTPAPPPHPDLEILDEKIGFARHLRVDVVRFRHRRFDGGWSGDRVFDVIRRGEAVAILLYDPDLDRIVLIEQFRLAALYGNRTPWQLEAVAGLVDTEETPEEVARRETREEAGLDPIGPLVPIQTIMPASGSLDEVIWLYCARVDSRGAGGVHGLAEEHEDIRVVVKDFSAIEPLLDSGEIESAHTLVMLSWLLRRRKRLRQLWGVD